MSVQLSDSLNVREAAEYLGISPASAYALKDRGLLPFYAAAVSKGFRIQRADLDAFIERRKVERRMEPHSWPEKSRPVRLKHLR